VRRGGPFCHNFLAQRYLGELSPWFTGTFSELLDKAVYDGGQLRAILFGSLWRRKSAVSKGLCERRTLGAHALNCPPLERPREKVPVHPGLSYAPGQLRTARTA